MAERTVFRARKQKGTTVRADSGHWSVLRCGNSSAERRNHITLAFASDTQTKSKMFLMSQRRGQCALAELLYWSCLRAIRARVRLDFPFWTFFRHGKRIFPAKKRWNRRIHSAFSDVDQHAQPGLFSNQLANSFKAPFARRRSYARSRPAAASGKNILRGWPRGRSLRERPASGGSRRIRRASAGGRWRAETSSSTI